MEKGIKKLLTQSGTFEGRGTNHEGQSFRGLLILTPRFDDRGSTIDFTATSEDSSVFHKEHSILGLTPVEGVSLWVLSSNHPGVVEHKFTDGEAEKGADFTLRFNFGNFDDKNSFRETISIDLWSNGDLSYRYAWGLPGGKFAERSSVRLSRSNNSSLQLEL